MGSLQSRSKTSDQPSKKTSKKKIRANIAQRNHGKTEKQNGDLSGDRRPPLTASYSTEKIDGGPVKEYRMSRKGPVLIINNYAGNGEFEFRHGGALDGGKLQSCFERLGFSEIDCLQNLKCEEMKTACHKFAWKDFRQADCMIAVILTHGKSPDLLQGVDGKYVHFGDLFTCFHPSLVGKPKIIIIQACRGDQPNEAIRDTTSYPEGPEVRNYSGSFPPSFMQSDPPSSNQPNSGYLPRQADRVEAFATEIGHPAYRSVEKGSWYIEELTEALYEEYALRSKVSMFKSSKPRHFLDVLTEVQGRVSNYSTDEKFVQMPEFRSTLRGPIYFNSK